MTAGMVSTWERNHNRIYASQLAAVADVLNVTMDTLCDRVEPNTSSRQKMIEWYGYNRWDGDRVALIDLMGLYMALPVEYRREIALAGIVQLEQFVADGGIIPEEPPFDAAYVEKQCMELYKKRKAANKQR